MASKTKTLKAAAKRFKISGSGHVTRRQSGMRHILTKKSAKRKRCLKAPENLKSCDLQRLNRTLPNG